MVESLEERSETAGRRVRAYAVHLLTASGVVFAFLAAAEICAALPDPRKVFLYLAIQVLIDAVDGPLARRWHVKRYAKGIDGRTIDDIVDYLTYTFLPLLLIWRMNWVSQPAAAWVAPAMMASLFGFANTGAKDEGGGFFLGFPSYWNIVAFYCGIWHPLAGPWLGAIVIAALTVLTVLPVRFIYPNLAPRPWRGVTIVAGLVWLIALIVMGLSYPHAPAWLMWLSLCYPLLYLVLSMVLDIRGRQR